MKHKDLIHHSFLAHRKFMVKRMLSNKRLIQFVNKAAQILEDLENDKIPHVMKLPIKDCGQNLAIDIYLEICDNIQRRYELGRTSNFTIERIK